MTRLPIASVPVALGVLLLAATGSDVRAQDAMPPAHASYVDGQVVLDRDSGSDTLDTGAPLVPGDRVRTEQGRAELLFGDGSLVLLDTDTTIDLLADTRLRLLGGRLAIVASTAQGGRLQVDTPAGSVDVQSAGEYRLSLVDDGGQPTLELAVVRGIAGLSSDRDQVTVDAGERSWVRAGEAPAYPVRFNSARFDAFARWSQDRLAYHRGGTSYQYVPATLRPYAGVLDTYGSWSYEPTYGNVWYPRVGVGWRPYYSGRWRFYARFGWTWIGGDVWGWPTHHYGRWGLSTAGAWFWIPGPQWGPAWVSWAVASSYVSWCPMGYDNRPVLGFWGYRDYGGYRGYASHRGYGHDPWHAWTVIPRDHFGGYRSVSGVAIDGRRFGTSGARPAFVLQDRAPYAPSDRRGGVVAAGTSRGSLGVAVPRGGGEVPSFGGRGDRRYAAGASMPGRVGPPADTTPRADRVPRAVPGGLPGGPFSPTPSRRAGMETTPERASGGNRGPTALPRTMYPRSSGGYANRLPGDLGARTLPGDPGPRTFPGSREGMAVPRTGGSPPWSPDQVQVHRGMRVEPDAPAASPRTRAESMPAPGGWRGDGMRDGRGSAGPWSSPGMAVPRGSRGIPDSPRYNGPAPSYRAPAPSAPPPGPPPSASPRQAPPDSRGGGSAAPRGGPPPSRHR